MEVNDVYREYRGENETCTCLGSIVSDRCESDGVEFKIGSSHECLCGLIVSSLLGDGYVRIGC